MMIELPEEDWITILLALRMSARGRRVRTDKVREDCAQIADRVHASLQCAATMARIVVGLPPIPPVPPPKPDDWEGTPTVPVHKGFLGFLRGLIID